VSVKVLSPIARVAERGLTELFAATIQVTIDPEVVIDSQAGLPATAQVTYEVGVDVTMIFPEAPAAWTEADSGLRETVPAVPA
jgi:hypothetical protein